MIEAKNISKSFGDKLVLDNVSARFEAGKVNMVIGASGTGKSVFLKTIVGLVEPDEGSVFFHDRNFTEANRLERKEVRQEIGMLFQGAALFDSKNVEENVMFPLDMLTELPYEEKRVKVNDALEKVGLGGSNDKMPSELSGGMKKRVGIARAIVNSSKYLFCDEPNSGLDPQTSILIDDLIMELTKDLGTTTIVVSHDMNSVMNIGENIIFIREGRKLWEGHNYEILDTECEELRDFIFANKLMRALKDDDERPKGQ
ncbi:phosphonate ABC transporter ATP-binding protein [Fulvitalea axinellae]|uniref:Phosphonate ABC transporter ATP-binding protein n=1 Tax=Fulvitalea axinellae TaxID=1182444 RepID=A0AAU9D5X4_9BACT|nr:phosphonate ABC transporter ATP-binding protein [Fulvitalea axinellae]